MHENIHTVRRILEGDRRLTVAEIASEIRVSYGSAQAIITGELGFRKVATRWIPRLITEDQKRLRLEVYQRLLTRY